MKKIPLNSSLLMIILAIIVGNLTMPQSIMANNIDKESNTLYNIPIQNHYVSISPSSQYPQHDESYVWPIPSTSKISDVLTSSFTNILNTQIYTGLEK